MPTYNELLAPGHILFLSVYHANCNFAQNLCTRGKFCMFEEHYILLPKSTFAISTPPLP